MACPRGVLSLARCMSDMAGRRGCRCFYLWRSPCRVLVGVPLFVPPPLPRGPHRISQGGRQRNLEIKKTKEKCCSLLILVQDRRSRISRLHHSSFVPSCFGRCCRQSRVKSVLASPAAWCVIASIVRAPVPQHKHGALRSTVSDHASGVQCSDHSAVSTCRPCLESVRDDADIELCSKVVHTFFPAAS